MPSISSISASSIEIHRFIILPPISLKRIFPINVILPYLRKFCQANRPFSNAIFILYAKSPASTSETGLVVYISCRGAS